MYYGQSTCMNCRHSLCMYILKCTAVLLLLQCIPFPMHCYVARSGYSDVSAVRGLQKERSELLLLACTKFWCCRWTKCYFTANCCFILGLAPRLPLLYGTHNLALCLVFKISCPTANNSYSRMGMICARELFWLIPCMKSRSS